VLVGEGISRAYHGGTEDTEVPGREGEWGVESSVTYGLVYHALN
jgi:hypothetical protein